MLTTSWCAYTIHLADTLLNFPFPFIYANHKRVGALSYADSTAGMQALDQLSASPYHCLQRQPLHTPTIIMQLLPLIQVQAAVVFTIPTLPRRIKSKAVSALAQQYLSRKGVVERWSQQQPVVKVKIPSPWYSQLEEKRGYNQSRPGIYQPDGANPPGREGMLKLSRQAPISETRAVGRRAIKELRLRER